MPAQLARQRQRNAHKWRVRQGPVRDKVGPAICKSIQRFLLGYVECVIDSVDRARARASIKLTA